MMNKTKIKEKIYDGENGFTLIEVLFSMVILAVGLLSMASMQITAIQANAHAIHVSEATHLVEDILDEYQKMDFDDLVDEVVYRDIYTAEMRIPVDGNASMKKIHATVSWTTGSRKHEIEFGTIIGLK